MKIFTRCVITLVVALGCVWLDGPWWAGFLGGLIVSNQLLPERPE